MFDYIKGIAAGKYQDSKGTYLTIDVNGVGYLAEILPSDFNSGIKIGDEIKLFTVLIHKEDTMYLCGFLRKESRDIFKILTSVSGVGTKMALTLLNEFEASDLIYFVVNEDFKSLTAAKGVGAKLAQKIVLELKDKLINFQPALKITGVQDGLPDGADDVHKVLLSLGYDENEINDAMKKAMIKTKDIKSNEEFLRETLKILSV